MKDLTYSKLNLLVAYPYFSQKIRETLSKHDPDTFRLIIDSGAFSAWNSRKVIEFDDYCRFLDTIPSHWDYKAVQLDVFGDPVKTLENYYRMLDKGYDYVMPVFTRGDSLETLESLYENTDYIMFGGIVVGGKNTNYIKWFTEQNKDRKVHWLGYNNTEFIKHFKPTSVDSTAWNNGQKYGALDLYKGFGTFVNTTRKDWIEKPTDRMIKLVSQLGIEPKHYRKLGYKEAWQGGGHHYTTDTNEFDGKLRGLSTCIQTRSHLKRGLDIEKNLGTKVYFAVGNNSQINVLFMSMNELKKRKLN